MKKIKKTQRRQRCRHERRENQKIIIIIIIIMREKKEEIEREKVEHVRGKVKSGHTSFIKKKIYYNLMLKFKIYSL